jgi:2-hydroxychromene-2-carboxylate isomerase
MQRRAADHDLTFRKPDPFPQNGLLVARVAQLALKDPGGIAFCQNVYLAQFDAGQDISDPALITACLSAAGLPASLIDDAQSDTNKHDLRLTTDEAAKRGLFGAPSFLVGDELFWGDDRLEDALEWARRA